MYFLTDNRSQAITLTSDIPTWRIKCPQSRKNCQIYPTKCRKNVMEQKFLFSIISYWFSAWIKPCKPRFIMGENGGCWQSCRGCQEQKFLFSIISYWFSAWIKPCKPRFIMGENGGCWQSCRGWPQTLPLNCSNQATLMPLFFSHVN